MTIKEGIEQGIYSKGLSKRLKIDGVTKDYPSYKIPLDMLFYNDLNGRISTHIQQYKSENNQDLNDILVKDREKYNDIIGEFIKESSNDDQASFIKTKNDIKQNGQIEVGVILDDGRIIDGNRRFTALRDLFKETGNPKYKYFEAVQFATPSVEDKDGWQKIKFLELNLQFNVDNKKDYNKIDFLVSFYTDTMEDKPNRIDQKQYCFASGMKPGEYKTNKLIVETMLDYLRWRGVPNAFYLLKNEKLDGPIEDIAKKRSKLSESEWNANKAYIYNCMTFSGNDRTRIIRQLMDSLIKGGSLFDIMKQSMDSPALIQSQKAVRLMNLKTQMTGEQASDLDKSKQELSSKIENAFREGIYKEGASKTLSSPLNYLNEALKNIDLLNPLQIKDFPVDKKDEIKNTLSSLISKLESIKNEIE